MRVEIAKEEEKEKGKIRHPTPDDSSKSQNLFFKESLKATRQSPTPMTNRKLFQLPALARRKLLQLTALARGSNVKHVGKTILEKLA